MSRHHRSTIVPVVVLVVAGVGSGCSKKSSDAPEPAKVAVAVPEAEAKAPPPPSSPAAAPAEAAPAEPPRPAPPDRPTADQLVANAWGLAPKAAKVEAGQRVFLLTQGRIRTYLDEKARYQLYAYDVAAVEGTLVRLKELGGGEFLAPGLFVLPAGPVKDAPPLKVGEPVLAEWAGELKHAVVEKVDGTSVDVRYTDLPDSWEEAKLKGKLQVRQVTRQIDGINAGAYAAARLKDSQDWHQVLLVSEVDGGRWVVQLFSKLASVVEKANVRPVPVKPSFKPGDKVLAVWVGKFVPGTVKEVKGDRFVVDLDNNVSLGKPVTVGPGWIMPAPKDK